MEPTSHLLLETRQTFPLMDLPTEVRLIIYENLPRQIKHHRISISPSAGKITLIRRCTPTAILRACKTIYTEANTLIQRTIAKFILAKVPQFASTSHYSATLVSELIMASAVREADRILSLRHQGVKFPDLPERRPVGLDMFLSLDQFYGRIICTKPQDEDHLTACLQENLPVIIPYINQAAQQLLHHGYNGSGGPLGGIPCPKPLFECIGMYTCKECRPREHDVPQLRCGWHLNTPHRFTTGFSVTLHLPRSRIHHGVALGIAGYVFDSEELQSSGASMVEYWAFENSIFTATKMEESQITVLPAMTQEEFGREWLERERVLK